MENLNKEISPLEEALSIAARIIEQNNGALIERISALEEEVKRLQTRIEELEQTPVAEDYNIIPVETDNSFTDEDDSMETVDSADSTDPIGEMSLFLDEDTTDDEELMAVEEELIAAEEDTSVVEEDISVDDEEIFAPSEEGDMGIPHSMAGLGVMEFASELAEKANESAPGNDVFELMERQEAKIINEAARPDWYDWEVDYPASYVEDVYKAISFNDRYEFIKELFNMSGDLGEAEYLFRDTLDDINEMENFKQVVAYIRHRFPQWDEQSDEVYRFYMAVRRKFNK